MTKPTAMLWSNLPPTNKNKWKKKKKRKYEIPGGGGGSRDITLPKRNNSL